MTKLSTIVNISDSLTYLATVKLKPAAGFRVALFLKQAEDYLKTFEGQRLVLAKEHGTLNKEGNYYEFPDAEQRELFEDGINSLLEMATSLVVPNLNMATDFSESSEYIAANLVPLEGVVLKDTNVVGKAKVTIEVRRLETPALMEGLTALAQIPVKRDLAATLVAMITYLDAELKSYSQQEAALIEKGTTPEEIAGFGEQIVSLVMPKLSLEEFEGIELQAGDYAKLALLLTM